MAGYDFPEVNFDWLGRLPAVADEAQQKAATKEALAGLKSGDYGSVRSAAADLLRAGGNPDLAVKLLNAATADYAAQARNAEMAQYNAFILGLAGKGGLKPTAPIGPGLPAETDMGGSGGLLPPTPAAPSNAPPPVPTPAFPTPGSGNVLPPGTVGPGPQSSIGAPPPSVAQTAQLPPVPGEQTPSEVILAKAEGGMAPVGTPPTRLAGPPPTPDTSQIPPAPPVPPAPPAPPPAVAPSMAAGAAQQFLQTGGRTPTVAPTGPTQAPQQSGLGTAIPTQLNDPRLALKAIEDQLIRLPMHAVNSPVGQALMKQHSQILDQLKLTPSMLEYRQALIQDMRNGSPYYSYQEFLDRPKILPQVHKEMQDAYKTYREDRISSEKIVDTTRRIQALMNNKDAISGTGTEAGRQIFGHLNTLRLGLKSLGIDVPEIKDIPGLSGPARASAIAEAATSLSNKTVVAMLGGSLGKAISDADREFLAKAYFSLGNSPAGNKLLLDMALDMGQQAVKTGLAVEKYRADVGEQKATVVGLDRAARSVESLLANPDGTLTDKGREYQTRMDEILKEIGQSSPVPQALQTGRSEIGGIVSGTGIPQAVRGAVKGALEAMPQFPSAIPDIPMPRSRFRGSAPQQPTPSPTQVLPGTPAREAPPPLQPPGTEAYSYRGPGGLGMFRRPQIPEAPYNYTPIPAGPGGYQERRRLKNEGR